MEAHLFLIPLISLLAFFLKGITGTGTSTVIVSLCSLIISPKWAVILASFINIFGGLAMIKVDPVPLKPRYWMAVATTMVIGSIAGAYALKVVPNNRFDLILGVAFFLASLWFLFRVSVRPVEQKGSPEIASKLDLGVGTFAGFCGGFIGINAPPLILHFGRYLDKRHLRRLLVLIFIPAAVAQTATFAAAGLLTREIIIMACLMVPTMGFGIFLGNRAHFKISEATFKRTLGALLLVVSVRLILRSTLS